MPACATDWERLDMLKKTLAIERERLDTMEICLLVQTDRERGDMLDTHSP